MFEYLCNLGEVEHALGSVYGIRMGEVLLLRFALLCPMLLPKNEDKIRVSSKEEKEDVRTFYTISTLSRKRHYPSSTFNITFLFGSRSIENVVSIVG